jgi:hypothetical protein
MPLFFGLEGRQYGCAERREEKGERRAEEERGTGRRGARPLRENGYKCEDGYTRFDAAVLRPGRPSVRLRREERGER